MAKKSEPEELPLVAGSGQSGKVEFGIGALIVAAVASIVQLVGPSTLKTPAIVAAVVAGLAGINALLLVRCPSCGHSLGLWAVRTGGLTGWSEKLEKVTACPSCGHTVAKR